MNSFFKDNDRSPRPQTEQYKINESSAGEVLDVNSEAPLGAQQGGKPHFMSNKKGKYENTSWQFLLRNTNFFPHV